ncbi:hypothetical protein QYE76_009316 [Lolium multiflorum]|uniref:Uncharacterized protein n=1 Tax=Lolium multiflorum TaxID=4521 RepID=A0AAD8TV65_LOLMU|nr:hypothetical protein QYE76_009316 [Lolium multiflorum]
MWWEPAQNLPPPPRPLLRQQATSQDSFYQSSYYDEGSNRLQYRLEAINQAYDSFFFWYDPKYLAMMLLSRAQRSSESEGQEWRMLLTQRKQRGISIPEEASSPLSLASCCLPPPVSNVMFTAMLQRHPQAHHFPALALAHCPCRPSMVESLWMERGEGLGIRVYGVPHDSRPVQGNTFRMWQSRASFLIPVSVLIKYQAGHCKENRNPSPWHEDCWLRSLYANTYGSQQLESVADSATGHVDHATEEMKADKAKMAALSDALKAVAIEMEELESSVKNNTQAMHHIVNAPLSTICARL